MSSISSESLPINADIRTWGTNDLNHFISAAIKEEGPHTTFKIKETSQRYGLDQIAARLLVLIQTAEPDSIETRLFNVRVIIDNLIDKDLHATEIQKLENIYKQVMELGEKVKSAFIRKKLTISPLAPLPLESDLATSREEAKEPLPLQDKKTTPLLKPVKSKTNRKSSIDHPDPVPSSPIMEGHDMSTSSPVASNPHQFSVGIGMGLAEVIFSSLKSQTQIVAEALLSASKSKDSIIQSEIQALESIQAVPSQPGLFFIKKPGKSQKPIGPKSIKIYIDERRNPDLYCREINEKALEIWFKIVKKHLSIASPTLTADG